MKNLHESLVDFLQHPYIYLDYCFFSSAAFFYSRSKFSSPLKKRDRNERYWRYKSKILSLLNKASMTKKNCQAIWLNTELDSLWLM